MADIPFADQVQGAVEAAAAPKAVGFLGIPGTPSLDLGDAKPRIVKELDTVIKALDVILGYSWLIPDQYETPLKTLNGALKKVRGWIA